MNEELTNAVAGEIRRLHQEAESNASTAKDAANKAMVAAIQCGDYLNQADKATKGHLLAWLRDNVPDLTHERAKAYLSLFNTYRRREETRIDHRAMIQLEIIEVMDAPSKSTGDFKDPKWVSWIGSTRAHFDSLTKKRPISEWRQDERDAVAVQLAPIIALWRELTGEGA